MPPPAPLRTLLHSMRMEGTWRALCDLAIARLRYSASTDDHFDRARGTQTAGSVETHALEIGDPVARASAVAYMPSPARVTRWILRSLPIDPSQFAFVDVGCGKGRVLLVASEQPFRQIRGVEISTALAAIAEHNLERDRGPRRCRDVRVICADAREVELPPAPIVFHLYNPFGPVVLRSFLARVLERYPQGSEAVWFVYLAPRYFVDPVAQTFGRFPAFARVAYHPSLSGDYDWLVFRAGAA